MKIDNFERRENMQVLFISQQLAENNNVMNGGNVCSKSLYHSFCLAVGKNNVKLIHIPEEKNMFKRYIHYLFLRNMYTKKQENQIVNQINSSQYDLIVLDGSWFGKILNRVSKKKKIALFLHNIEIDYSIQRFRKNRLTYFKLRSVRYNEQKAINFADYIFVLNDRDQELLHKYYERKADLLLPIVIDDKYSGGKKQITETKDTYLLFVGSYFTPNVEGIKWFVENVMPHIHKKLVVAGKNTERLKYLETFNVEILGTVDDLEELYVNAEAVVLPIFSGGGMKVKTAEALMYGKRIYGTDEALIGYDIEDLKHIVQCNTAEEFIANINMEHERQYFVSEVRDKFLEKYEQKSRDIAVKNFLLEELTEEAFFD